MNRPENFAEVEPLTALIAYRPFVDGLRAVSILLVVLYHVGLSMVPGGYVGVDIFFVISGFLIINQIRAGLETGSFSFADFWSRRAVRILPPYLLVVAAASLAAPFFLVLPQDFHRLGEEVLHSALMVVNHLYLRLQGYFDVAADSKVLLNLWSLSVEEQFYLAAPLVLAALAWASSRGTRPGNERRLMLVTAALFALSLAACIYFTRGTPERNYAFYLAPLRAWEFMAGGSIALLLPFVRRLPRLLLSGLAAGGLAAILISAFVFSQSTPYPSGYALLPALGATAVILAGVAAPHNPVARILATRPLVAIGLVSYSWYLWHWPLLVFARRHAFGDRVLLHDAAAVLLALALAAATWRFIERPLREWRRSRRQSLGWRPALAGICISVAAAFGGSHFFDTAERRILAETPPAQLPAAPGPLTHCELSDPNAAGACLRYAAGRPLGLVVGDSHARAALATMDKFAASHGSALAALVQAGCPGIFGVRLYGVSSEHQRSCAAYQERIASFVAERKVAPAYAMIATRWLELVGENPETPLGPVGGDRPEADQPAYFVAALRETVRSLRSLGAERILILEPLPTFRRHPPTCFFIAGRRGMDLGEACGEELSRGEKTRSIVRRQIEDAVAGLDYVRLVDPTPEFCDAELCMPFHDGTVLFFDHDHISEAGMDRIVAAHRAAFEWLVAGKEK